MSKVVEDAFEADLSQGGKGSWNAEFRSSLKIGQGYENIAPCVSIIFSDIEYGEQKSEKGEFSRPLFYQSPVVEYGLRSKKKARLKYSISYMCLICLISPRSIAHFHSYLDLVQHLFSHLYIVQLKCAQMFLLDVPPQ
jgi:hypothetical protein